MKAVLCESFGPAELSVLEGLQDATLLTHPLSGTNPVTSAGDMPSGLSADGSAFVAPVVTDPHPVFLYGAGHIGRALAPHLAALDCDLHWVDIAAGRFPDMVPAGVEQVIATDPTVIASHAPPHALLFFFFLLLFVVALLLFPLCFSCCFSFSRSGATLYCRQRLHALQPGVPPGPASSCR